MKNRWIQHVALAIAAAWFGVGSASTIAAAEIDAASLDFFEKEVRPILIARCYKCHSTEGKKKGGLLLDSKAGWTVGGDSGPAIVARNPDGSLIIEAVRYKNDEVQMPPKGKIPDSEIAVLVKWVKMGAPDPRDDAKPITGPREVDIEKGREFWSFKPITKPLPPRAKADQWSRSDIDRFIFSKLASKHLSPAAAASRETLIRRAYLDLIGLPPSPAQIDAFFNDQSADAFASVVDELLASSHFGERWGRHWLDICRYAESSGGGRTLIFPNAWRFRDYVIRSFNDDKPYDQFVREQIAGDLLPYKSSEQRADQLTGSGYLMLGAINYELQDKELLRMEVIDEQINTMGRTFLGLTLGCARCHDHKFDPIPTKDYYALAGIFRSTKSMLPGNVAQFIETELPLSSEQLAARKKIDSAVDSLSRQVTAAKASLRKQQEQLAKLTGKPIKTASNSKGKKPAGSHSVPVAKLPGIVVDDVQAELEGNWTKSVSVPRYVEAGYQHALGGAKATATYKIALPKPGRYEVRASFAANPNRTSRVEFEVQHAEGVASKAVNQQRRPDIDGLFVSLGTHAFGASGKVVIDVSKASGVVIIDAVQFLPIDQTVLAAKSEPTETVAFKKPSGKTWPGLPSNVTPLTEKFPSHVTARQVDRPSFLRFIVSDKADLPGIVLDDTEAKLVGDWQHSVHTPPFVGKSYIHDGNEKKGEKSATFTPRISKAGLYEVRVGHNANSSRSRRVPIEVKHADGETVVKVNQHNLAPVGALFRPIGRFRFEQGDSGSVVISNEGTDDGHVIVDSVWFVPVELIGKSVAAAPKLATLARLSAAELKKEPVLDAEKLQRIKSLTDEVEDATKLVAELEAKLKSIRGKRPKGAKVMSVLDHTEIGDYHVCIRGSAHNLGDKVPRGFLQVITPKGVTARPQLPEKESGRLQLAHWLASADNPLTARVMANRIWLHLMGRGIVPTPDNFGSPGELPTHPLLLDHLSTQFIADGWSVKKLIRSIMLSRTYQMSSQVNLNAASIDPENRFYHRVDRKRLDAEVIRDVMLSVSGQLELNPGGPGMRSGTRSELGYKFSSLRRSAYVPVFRNTVDPLFVVFDFANPNVVTGDRKTSTLPTQALYLMNSPFVQSQARATAERILVSKANSDDDRIVDLYRRMLGRKPSAREAEIAAKLIATFNPNGEKDEKRRRLDAWTGLVHNLFASLDFRYQK